MGTIRVIVSDIDGTLMTDKGVIPPEIHDVLDSLLPMGVKFVVASGRQINNLHALFGPHAEDLFYIAQNGAIIAQGGQILYEKRMNAKSVEKCVSIGRQSHVFSMLYTDDIVVVEDADPEFLSFLDYYHVEYRLSESLDAYFDKTYKLSYFKKEGGISELKNAVTDKEVNVFLVNDYLIDITDSDTDKGTGIRRLRKLLGVRKNEVVVFGDSENDLSMFAETSRSYAVGNAPDPVREKAAAVIPSNNENGVIVALKELFNLY